MMFGFLDWFIVSVLTALTQDFLILEYAEEDDGKEIEVRWGEEEGRRHTKFQRSCVELDGAWRSREKEFEMLLWGVYANYIKYLTSGEFNLSKNMKKTFLWPPPLPSPPSPLPLKCMTKYPNSPRLSQKTMIVDAFFVRDKRWWRTKFRCCCVFVGTATPSHSKRLQK